MTNELNLEEINKYGKMSADEVIKYLKLVTIESYADKFYEKFLK